MASCCIFLHPQKYQSSRIYLWYVACRGMYVLYIYTCMHMPYLLFKKRKNNVYGTYHTTWSTRPWHMSFRDIVGEICTMHMKLNCIVPKDIFHNSKQDITLRIYSIRCGCIVWVPKKKALVDYFIPSKLVLMFLTVNTISDWYIINIAVSTGLPNSISRFFTTYVLCTRTIKVSLLVATFFYWLRTTVRL